MQGVSFRVAAGDKVGLVGRNGAGKTTLTRILAGEGLPAGGKVLRTGEIGYLPQDPRTADPAVLALPRVLSARRSEERRVGKEGRVRWWADHYKKKAAL